MTASLIGQIVVKDTRKLHFPRKYYEAFGGIIGFPTSRLCFIWIANYIKFLHKGNNLSIKPKNKTGKRNRKNKRSIAVGLLVSIAVSGIREALSRANAAC